METGTCSLCGKLTELIGVSHIIPKFMYKGMEDERNKIGLTIVKDGIKKESEIDYRYFDKYILCKNCDTVALSHLENYGNRVLFGDQTVKDSFLSKSVNYPEFKLCTIENFDYKKFKLFLLSILWRAHISKHIFFKNINLDERAEIIRQSILTSNIDSIENISISILGLMFDRTKLYKSVASPRHIKNNEVDIYYFMIYGIVYNFIYKDDKNLFSSKENMLKANQPLHIPFYLAEDAANFFRAFVMPKGY